MNHSAEPGRGPPWLVDLVQLEIHDRVGEDQVAEALWKNTNSLKMPPGKSV